MEHQPAFTRHHTAVLPAWDAGLAPTAGGISGEHPATGPVGEHSRLYRPSRRRCATPWGILVARCTDRRKLVAADQIGARVDLIATDTRLWRTTDYVTKTGDGTRSSTTITRSPVIACRRASLVRKVGAASTRVVAGTMHRVSGLTTSLRRPQPTSKR